MLLAVAAVAGLVMTGCKAAPKEAVTLKVWESEGVEKDFVLWAGEEFKKTHPNVTIEYEPVGSADARAKIELDGPAGVGADVFVAPHDHLGALISGGHVLENTTANFKDNFVDAAVIGSTYNGKVYGYPLAIETYGLFYNKKIISDPPKTWDDVETFAKTYNNKAENKYALVWEVANAYFDYIFMGGFGAPLFGPNGNDRAQHNINSANAIAGLTYFQSLRKKILDVPSADMSGDFCNSSFVEGKSAMIITGPWKIADFTKAGLDFGIVPIPVFPGQTANPASFSGVRLAFVSAYTKHEAEARAFAEFLFSKASLEKRFAVTNQIPPRKDITISDPLSNGILAQAKFATPMPTIPQMGTYWSAMGAAFASIWDGSDVTKELTAAAKAMEAAK
jgi:arabinogalactan oligomer/maltooligosaccharide transport system substrate-binding protein